MEGRSILPAGTIYPANDETAEGILASAVDTTNGPQPGTLYVSAILFVERLPVAPTLEAEKAMPKIMFR